MEIVTKKLNVPETSVDIKTKGNWEQITVKIKPQHRIDLQGLKELATIAIKSVK